MSNFAPHIIRFSMTISRTSLRLFSANTLSLAYSNNKPMRWGILSAGKISQDFVKAMGQTDSAEVSALFCVFVDMYVYFINSLLLILPSLSNRL